MTPEKIEETWRSIEAEGRTERGWHVRNVPGAGERGLKIGKRMPSGALGLLYDIGSVHIPTDIKWPDAKGFSTAIESLTPGPNGEVRLILELSNKQYRDVFSALCGDVSSVVMESLNEKDGIRAFVRRLHAWQSFMQFHSKSGLSSKQVRGLYAELSVLEHLLFPNFGPVAAVTQWQGRHGLHDFMNSKRSLEIKSGTGSADPVFSVSKLNQFDETAVDVLYLCFVQIDEDEEDGECLPEAISRLKKMLQVHPGAKQRIEDLLVEFGYHDSQAALYADLSLRAGEPQLFRVSEGFPRLRKSDLHDGIVSGSYSVKLSSCYDYRTTETEFLIGYRGEDCRAD